MNYPSYVRIAIHSLGGYMDHWFVNTPNDQIGWAPEGTEMAYLNQDDFHWAEQVN